MRDGRLARNPAQRVPLPRWASTVDALADAAGGYRLVILFLAYTGVRYGEMAAGAQSRSAQATRLDLRSWTSAAAPCSTLQRTTNNGRCRCRGSSSRTWRNTSPSSSPTTSSSLLIEAGCCTCATSAGRLRSGRTRRRPRWSDAARASSNGGQFRIRREREGRPDDAGLKSATMTLDLYGRLLGDQLNEIADAMDAARTAAQDHADASGLNPS